MYKKILISLFIFTSLYANKKTRMVGNDVCNGIKYTVQKECSGHSVVYIASSNNHTITVKQNRSAITGTKANNKSKLKLSLGKEKNIYFTVRKGPEQKLSKKDSEDYFYFFATIGLEELSY